MTARNGWMGASLVALTLLAWQGGFGGCRYSRHAFARYAIKYTAEGIAGFRADHGRLPETLEEAVACGSYLRPREIVDPWRRAYFYRRSEEGFTLLSLAEDGLPGGSGEDADLMVQAAPEDDEFVYRLF